MVGGVPAVIPCRYSVMSAISVSLMRLCGGQGQSVSALLAHFFAYDLRFGRVPFSSESMGDTTWNGVLCNY